MSLCGDIMKNGVCLLILMVTSAAANEDLYEDSLYKDAILFVKNCEYRHLSLCLKEKALKFIEQLPNNVEIGSGISIKRNESERSFKDYIPKALPNEIREREAIVDKILVERLVDYLKSHTLELKIPLNSVMGGNDKEELTSTGRDKGGYGLGFGDGHGGGYGGGYGGGKKNKKGNRGGMGLIMMLFYMKMAAMYAIALKLIGMMAFKALLVAKVALTIAAIIGLKRVVEGAKGASTYEVIAHPAHSSDHHDRHDRNFNPMDVVYKGHKVGV